MRSIFGSDVREQQTHRHIPQKVDHTLKYITVHVHLYSNLFTWQNEKITWLCAFKAQTQLPLQFKKDMKPTFFTQYTHLHAPS